MTHTQTHFTAYKYTTQMGRIIFLTYWIINVWKHLNQPTNQNRHILNWEETTNGCLTLWFTPRLHQSHDRASLTEDVMWRKCWSRNIISWRLRKKKNLRSDLTSGCRFLHGSFMLMSHAFGTCHQHVTVILDAILFLPKETRKNDSIQRNSVFISWSSALIHHGL